MADQPSPAPDVSAPPGRVTDHRRLPLGVVPRTCSSGCSSASPSSWSASWRSPGRRRAARAVTPSPAAVAVDPNQQRIEEYQRRIQEQAQRLAAEQAQLQLTKDALAAAPADDGWRGAASCPCRGLGADRRRRPSTRDTREDRARVADNVAFSRPGTTGARTRRRRRRPVRLSIDSGAADAPAGRRRPTDVPGVPGAARRAAPRRAATPPVAAPAARVAAPTVPGEPRYTLFEGTIIETVLTNRLDGTFSGP